MYPTRKAIVMLTAAGAALAPLASAMASSNSAAPLPKLDLGFPPNRGGFGYAASGWIAAAS